MATFFSSSTSSKGQTAQAIFMLFVLTVLGALHINIFGKSVALSFIPLIGICLWPRHANPILSVIAIFILGVVFDFITNEALGFRTMIYLAVFAIFRPDKRLKAHIFGTAFAQWLGVIVIAILFVYLIGWIGRGTKPNLMTLVFQVLLATVFFPIIYLLRHLIRYTFVDVDDRY